jgi:hypothetical protein
MVVCISIIGYPNLVVLARHCAAQVVISPKLRLLCGFRVPLAIVDALIRLGVVQECQRKLQNHCWAVSSLRYSPGISIRPDKCTRHHYCARCRIRWLSSACNWSVALATDCGACQTSSKATRQRFSVPSAIATNASQCHKLADELNEAECSWSWLHLA